MRCEQYSPSQVLVAALFGFYTLMGGGRSSLVEGMVGYFENGCPDGWTDFTDGAGRVIVGAGQFTDDQTSEQVTYTVGQTGGERSHQLTEDELPNHTHSSDPDAVVLKQDGQDTFTGSSGNNNNRPNLVSSVTLESSGSDQSHNNMQPFIVLKACQTIHSNDSWALSSEMDDIHEQVNDHQNLIENLQRRVALLEASEQQRNEEDADGDDGSTIQAAGAWLGLLTAWLSLICCCLCCLCRIQWKMHHKPDPDTNEAGVPNSLMQDFLLPQQLFRWKRSDADKTEESWSEKMDKTSRQVKSATLEKNEPYLKKYPTSNSVFIDDDTAKHQKDLPSLTTASRLAAVSLVSNSPGSSSHKPPPLPPDVLPFSLNQEVVGKPLAYVQEVDY